MTKHYGKILAILGLGRASTICQVDVQIVLKDLLDRNAVESQEEIKSKNLTSEQIPFYKSANQFSTMIQKHSPASPCCRLCDIRVQMFK